jgi:hypothetical protein
MKLTNLLAIIGVFALAACATTASVYHPAASDIPNSLGYTDKQVDPTHFEVKFVAPKEAGNQTAADMAMLRAAELTTAKGHTWFRLINRTIAEVQVSAPTQTFNTSNQNLTCNTGTSASQGTAGIGPGQMGCSRAFSQNAVAGVAIGTSGGYETRIMAILEFEVGDGAAPSGPQVYDAKATAARIRAEMAKS